MISQILRDQLEELREMFSGKRIVERECMKKFLEISKSRLIKVISGIRRAGKSFLTYMLIKDRKFAYANFDEEVITNVSFRELISALHEVFGNFNTVFFDEVQNLKEWEIFVNKLHRRGLNIFITGSNSKLLSSELASRLTGRHIVLEIFPFSFREFLLSRDFSFGEFTSKKKGILLNLLEEYLKVGGFPEVVVEGENPRIYLRSLFNQIIEKDVIKRKKVRYSEALKEVAYYLLSNPSNLMSFSKIKRVFGFRSEHTVKNYINYLEESYLFFFLKRFSFKVREIERSERKIYPLDTGFINFVGFKLSKDLGRIMENAVAIDLIRRRSYFDDFDIYYFRDSQGREIDFVIKRGGVIKELIQVTYSNSFEEINPREWRNLILISRKLKCKNLIVITWDYEEERELEWYGTKRKIRFIPLWKWLLKVQ